MIYDSDHPLAQQTAIVTGGSSGIGKACAIALGQAGANVIVNYAGNPRGAEESVAEIEAAGGKGLPFKADVSQKSQVEAMFKAAVNTLTISISVL